MEDSATCFCSLLRHTQLWCWNLAMLAKLLLPDAGLKAKQYFSWILNYYVALQSKALAAKVYWIEQCCVLLFMYSTSHL